MEFGEGISIEKFKELQKKSDKGGNARRNKYNAQKTMYNGVMYDSKWESRVAYKLDMLRKAEGKDRVTDIERQVHFSFDHNGVHICKYVCDFKVTFADGRIEYWDAKGVEMREGRIKMKLMEAYYGIKVKLIKES